LKAAVGHDGHEAENAETQKGAQMADGSIPVVMVRGKSLAETWEKSLVELWNNGARVRTQYDRRDAAGEYIDPASVDCTMVMVCEEPMSDPMIHRAFPGGLEDLEEYRLEVVEGIKNHWIRDPENPEDQRWEYTYNGRLTAYPVKKRGKNGGMMVEAFNQLDYIVEKLAQNPFTRRAIAHTWVVGEDNGYESPPCLQGVWVRALEVSDALALNMDVRFRSRDAYDAAFMNCFALMHLQAELGRRLSEKTGRAVRLGRYVDFADSYHIYGRRVEDFKERFLKLLEERSFEDRTWPLEFAKPIFDEARPKVLEKVRQQDASKKCARK